MKQPYSFINKLLPFVEEFLEVKKNQDNTIETFTLWLNQKLFSHEITEPGSMDKEHKKGDYHSKHDPDMLLVYLSLNIFKHVNYYSKLALEDSKLLGINDFLFLANLHRWESLKKADLIQASISEMPSGIEVIRRLLKHNLIDEYLDPDDKRAKRVKITKEGLKVLGDAINAMKKVGNLISGNLSDSQLLQLITILDQLNDFHREIFKKGKFKSIEELIHVIHNSE